MDNVFASDDTMNDEDAVGGAESHSSSMSAVSQSSWVLLEANAPPTSLGEDVGGGETRHGRRRRRVRPGRRSGIAGRGRRTGPSLGEEDERALGMSRHGLIRGILYTAFCGPYARAAYLC
jgi:hypothetical protein